MPTTKPTQKRISPFAYLSIKYKLALSIALIVAVVVGVLYLVSAQSSNIMNTAYTQSSEYYNINSLQQHLIESDTLLQTYLSNVSSRSELQESWNSLRKTIESELSYLNTDTSRISVEQYFLAHALQVGFTPYAETCEALLNMGLSEIDDVTLYAQYQTAYNIFLHLNDTSLLLQTETLSAGQANLTALRIAMDNTTSSFTALAILLFFLFFFLISELIQVIVVPVLRLADASTAVRDGNFDTPDVILNNRDEIYTLALSFNEMKHSMKSLFLAMQRQTEMEQALHQKELEAQKNSALLAEAQMQQLRNQINPHFLFNTLNIISRTARSEKASKSEKLILALARLFRYGLKTDAEEVSLTREMNIVSDYIAIQSTRFSGRVALRWRIASNIDPEQVLVPTFLLQPLVENAVIHGLEPKLSGGTIRIRAQRQGSALSLTLTDNGIGMTKDVMERLLSQQSTKGHVSGIGVGNVRSRLQLLHPEATFTLLSRPNLGTSIRMYIPDAFVSPLDEAKQEEVDSNA